MSKMKVFGEVIRVVRITVIDTPKLLLYNNLRLTCEKRQSFVIRMINNKTYCYYRSTADFDIIVNASTTNDFMRRSIWTRRPVHARPPDSLYALTAHSYVSLRLPTRISHVVQ